MSSTGFRIGGIAETPEEALDADLREAALMLKQKQFRMLAHDFLPSFMAMRLEYNAGRKRVESSPT